MEIRVLGSGAGGGFPQWNCNCDNCAGFRAAKIRASARTQSSIAVSSNGVDWLLINASPDIAKQLQDWPGSQPNRSKRDTAIQAVMLMDSQIDHTTGLLSLREGEALPLYCSSQVQQDLSVGFPLQSMLQYYCTLEHRLIDPDGQALSIPEVPGIAIEPIPIPGKAPPYSPHRHDPHVGDNIAVRLIDSDSGKSIFYAPGMGGYTDQVLSAMRNSDCLLVDGTFWREDEMLWRGVGEKMAAEMGHLPQSGEGGMIELLSGFNQRKCLIHINNTNPILDEDSPQRSELTAAGIEVCYDGMEVQV